MSAALHFHNLTLGYDRHPAVHHLNGVVQAGDLLAICGPNGAGKSTLLKSIKGLIPLLGGDIKLEMPSQHIAYLPQSLEIDRSFPISVYEFVSLGLWREVGVMGGLTHAQHHKIKDALHDVGLLGFERRQIGTLSGGQMQRMLFARLSLQDARVILLDEPFTAVDEPSSRHLLGLIKKWHDERRTILAVLHDLNMVRLHFPHCLLLARDVVAWGPSREALCAENLAKAATMIEPFDQFALNCERE